MKKNNSNITIFAILTTITLITWVFLEAYQRFYKSDIQTISNNILSPLTPTLDTSYLEEIAKRKQVTPEEIGQFRSSSKPIQNNSNNQQVSTQSAQPNQDIATSSGEAL